MTVFLRIYLPALLVMKVISLIRMLLNNHISVCCWTGFRLLRGCASVLYELKNVIGKCARENIVCSVWC